MVSITCHRITKSFNEFTALADISFEIGRGSIVGLLGPNGAGKSTLIRILTGIMRPDSGEAVVYGHSLSKRKEKVKAITGLLPEEAALYEKLSVWEYIEYIGALYSLEEEEISSHFNELSLRLRVRDLRDRLIETLSKGQKQKVALIASMIHRPLALFLDEPMSNLDVLAQREVKKIIREYSSNERTVVIASHLMENIQNLCNYLILIDHGKIIDHGRLEDLLHDQESLEDVYVSTFGGD